MALNRTYGCQAGATRHGKLARRSRPSGGYMPTVGVVIVTWPHLASGPTWTISCERHKC